LQTVEQNLLDANAFVRFIVNPEFENQSSIKDYLGIIFSMQSMVKI